MALPIPATPQPVAASIAVSSTGKAKSAPIAPPAATITQR